MLSTRYLKQEDDVDDVLRKIHEVASVHTNMHFVYTSGEHGDGYVNLRVLGRLPNHAHIIREASLLLLKRIIKRAKLDVKKLIVIVGPETLGAYMVKQIYYASSTELAGILEDRSMLQFYILKKAESGFEWRSDPIGIDHEAQVVFFDDMLNAASTFEKTRQLVEARGAKISAIGVIGDRSGLTAAELGVRHVEALERFNFKRYDASDCPLCQKQIPIVLSPGHGSEFKDVHPDYPGGFKKL